MEGPQLTYCQPLAENSTYCVTFVWILRMLSQIDPILLASDPHSRYPAHRRPPALFRRVGQASHDGGIVFQCCSPLKFTHIFTLKFSEPSALQVVRQDPWEDHPRRRLLVGLHAA